MVEKQLKSITFPGINESYFIPDSFVAKDDNSDGHIEFLHYIPEQNVVQIDKSLNVAGAAADAKAVGDHTKSKENPHNITPGQLGMPDYIVEQGVSGDWTYRKWNSGVYECWGEIKTTVAGTNALFGGSCCHFTVELPITFPTIPIVNYSIYGNSGYEYAGKAMMYSPCSRFTGYSFSNSAYNIGDEITVYSHVIGHI